MWNVLTVFQEASRHRSALCSRVISAEPVICTHQAFIVFSVTAYPPWCRLPINNLAVSCPELYLGRMFGPRCHLLLLSFSIWFYICILLHNKIHWSFRIKRTYPGFCIPLTVSYENVASIVLCGINREMCAYLMCFERIFPHPHSIKFSTLQTCTEIINSPFIKPKLALLANAGRLFGKYWSELLDTVYLFSLPCSSLTCNAMLCPKEQVPAFLGVQWIMINKGLDSNWALYNPLKNALMTSIPILQISLGHT